MNSLTNLRHYDRRLHGPFRIQAIAAGATIFIAQIRLWPYLFRELGILEWSIEMNHLALFVQQNQVDPEMAQKVAMAMLAILPIIMIIGIAILMVPCWFICKKAGFSPWLSLLCIIPSLGTLVLLYILAFVEWKVAPAPQQGWAPPYPPQPPYPPPQA